MKNIKNFESFLNEAKSNPSFDNKVKKFIKNIQDSFGYSEEDALYAIYNTLDYLFPGFRIKNINPND